MVRGGSADSTDHIGDSAQLRRPGHQNLVPPTGQTKTGAQNKISNIIYSISGPISPISSVKSSILGIFIPSDM